eukprot:9834373-Ditylum_brightwellii.AAC.1
MITSNMADDDVIIISMHIIGLIFYNNGVDIGDNFILLRELLCCSEKCPILVTLIDGDTIRYVEIYRFRPIALIFVSASYI